MASIPCLPEEGYDFSHSVEILQLGSVQKRGFWSISFPVQEAYEVRLPCNQWYFFTAARERFYQLDFQALSMILLKLCT